ncbi:hypothetical protein N5853_14640 (plasmid) [Bartonella sp. HY329]|uniref:hypothetical protein n=1 Tax=unclassified Bartonella TaxID=2645622 RepID=UPI0021CABFD3|nr:MULTISPECIES: hypothetical protein [unclassified Bartonella]UXM96553.1 hypothetical protein N5853_14640 [Bartonella sp. HY329]UXN10876.1 hypothetical protein N5852_14645 [Bartonella sp. HY328]
MNILEVIFLTILCGLLIVVAHYIGYSDVDIVVSLTGVGIIIGVGICGYIIAKLPLFNMLPSILWISALAILVSSPIFPYHEIINFYVAKIPFLAICTPVLAYAGLSIGKDLEAFKKISWRIIPVALAVIAGTFICATMLAQWALHIEGAI